MLAIQRARDSFQSIQFIPSVPRDVSEVNLTQQVLGRETRMVFSTHALIAKLRGQLISMRVML